MYTIKGFTTKKDIGEQLASAGVLIKLPFTATNFKCTNPKLTGMKFLDSENKEQKLTIVSKESMDEAQKLVDELGIEIED